LRSALLAVPLLAAALWISPRLRPDPTPGFPRVLLWAWERPEDLRFVRPGSTGIAFLARTVWLDGDRVASRPRLQPLRFAPGAFLMAVVRLESSGHGLPQRRDNAVHEIVRAAEIDGVRALQIDFDARQSERAWYRDLLGDVRRALPVRLPLTITALESWCEEDAWIADLPVADATPMLFRMGAGEQAPRGDFSAPACRSSVGISTDELPARVPHGRRLYFFHPRAWTPEAYRNAMGQAGRWR
jgi:hypothetical protein